MAASTLIAITISSGNALAPMMHTQQFDSIAACTRAMELSVDGFKDLVEVNATGPYREVRITLDDGWLSVRTPIRSVGMTCSPPLTYQLN